VVELVQDCYHDLVLAEVRRPQVDRAAAGAVLAEAAQRAPRRALRIGDEVEGFLERCGWLAVAKPELGLPVLDDVWLGGLAAAMADGFVSFAELRELPVLQGIQAKLGQQVARSIERFAPERIRLPSGRLAKVEYRRGQDPVLAARVQEFFGLRDLAELTGGGGFVLHLLAPNQRPVQVTRDLPSFWASVYPKIRGELSRRYPKHSWPEDPLRAQPEQRPGRRS
jgi:ATP-dependent helicase HrpB